jgi:hypothetical protein
LLQLLLLLLLLLLLSSTAPKLDHPTSREATQTTAEPQERPRA